jgi:hypothetical protein
MNNIRFRSLLAANLATLLLQPLQIHAETQPAERGPVKVFILAGQSNMVGDGRLGPAETKGTLAYMVQKSDTQYGPGNDRASAAVTNRLLQANCLAGLPR